jgi:hypothetical protein
MDRLSGPWPPERVDGALDKSVGQGRNGQAGVCSNWTGHNGAVCDDETRKAENLAERIDHPMTGVAPH